MDKKDLAIARRTLLLAEIAAQGLSVVAKKANKPDRQINDMAAGRKSFGDGVAKEIGPLIRPDLPRDWLIYPDTINHQQEKTLTTTAVIENKIRHIKAESIATRLDAIAFQLEPKDWAMLERIIDYMESSRTQN